MISERELYQSIVADPGDVRRWLLWADWLEENGAPDQAEVIRLRSELTNAIEVPNRQHKELRLRELVYVQQVEPPVLVRTNGVGIDLHLIPPGSFLMGSPASEKDRYQDENQVAVHLTKAIWIGKWPVTQGQYYQVMGTNPSRFSKGSQYPVDCVPYEMALQFCKRLTEQERHMNTLPVDWEYSLPTEAQWEYACRAGSFTAYSFGNNVFQLISYAWYYGNSIKTTRPVGEKRCNAWCLYDMHGNIYEWCLGWYDDYLVGGIDPCGPATGDRRIIRGGCYVSDATQVRSARRNSTELNRQAWYYGFRIVLTPKALPIEPGKYKAISQL